MCLLSYADKGQKGVREIIVMGKEPAGKGGERVKVGNRQ